MTNREKYAEKILDIACDGYRVAVDKDTMEPMSCSTFRCARCLFDKIEKDCQTLQKAWCNAEYIEPDVPTTDWSKVPVDTPILVRDSEKSSWKHRYFAKYENNRVYAWTFGADSWSANNSYSNTNIWKYAKLPEESNE